VISVPRKRCQCSDEVGSFCACPEVLTISEETFCKEKNNNKTMHIMWYVVLSYPLSLIWMILCFCIGIKGGYLRGLYAPVPEHPWGYPWLDRMLGNLFNVHRISVPTVPSRNTRRRNATRRNTSCPPRTVTTKSTTTPAPPKDDKTTVVELGDATKAGQQEEVDLEAQTGTEAEQQLHDGNNKK